jgi:hypothetical protein
MQRLQQFTAVTLVLLLITYTMPLSASDPQSKQALGSVNVVGSVELRGIPLRTEGTLFAGDQIRVNDGGYAKLLFANGQKLEAGPKTLFVVTGRAGGTIEVELRSGKVGVSSSQPTPVHITVGPYEITSTKPFIGDVAYLSDAVAGVHVFTGSASVRNVKTKETYVVSQNQERLLALKGEAAPLVQLASNVPQPIPQTPAGKTQGSFPWWWVVAGGAAAGVTLGLVLAGNSGNTVSKTGATATVSSALATASQAQSTLSQASNVLTSTTNAINSATNLTASQKSALTQQSATVQAQVGTAASAISDLQNQLTQLQTQLLNASGSQVNAIQNQINTVTNLLNGEITVLNQALANLNTLIQNAISNGVQGVPNVTFQPIPPVTTASASTPH